MSAIARCYLVVSPKYGTVIPILDDGTGPTEYGCDVVCVFARNAKRAKVLGVRWFRRQGSRYLWYAENPFTGVKAENMAKYPEETPSEDENVDLLSHQGWSA